MTTENTPAAPAASATPAAAVVAPAAAAPAAVVPPVEDKTLALASVDAAAVAQKATDEAAAKKEAERVAALTPAQRDAEVAAKAKSDDEAKLKAEETRRAALTPEAREAEDEAKAKADAAAKANAVPEKYEFTLPDGLKLDEAITTEFAAKAKELGLSQEKAQALYDIGARAVQANHTAQAAETKTTQASWLAAAKIDKEFGGANLEANKVYMAAAMEFATPEMRTILQDSKLGDHPEVVRWMYRVGKQMTEDKHRTGRENNTLPNTFGGKAQAFYPGMNP